MLAQELREVIEEYVERHGSSMSFVAAKAGYTASHLAKILKRDRVIATDELERIAPVVGFKPGDLLENSQEDFRPILPLVEQIRKFHPDAYPRVADMLAAFHHAVSDTWLTTEINLDAETYASVHSSKIEQRKPTIYDESDRSVMPQGEGEGQPAEAPNAILSRRHGHQTSKPSTKGGRRS